MDETTPAPSSAPTTTRARRGRVRGRARRVAPLAAAVVFALGLAACSSGEPDLVVGDARASERLGGASQVVIDVDNRGEGDDRLVSATTPAAAGTEIHLTTIDDDGRATMATLDDVAIPAGEVTRFRPGGLHLMLTVPDESVVVGGTFDLTLHFDTTGEVTVPVTVVEQHELLEGPPGVDDPDAVDSSNDTSSDTSNDSSDDTDPADR